MPTQDDELYNSIMGITPTPEEEEQSLIRELAAKGMTGLQYIGETLDKPGQALRGMLAGKLSEAANLIPFSDALGITSSEGLFGGTPLQISDDEDAVSGRDLLEKVGWLGENQEGLDWGDVAGFAADVVTDPTTWIPGVGMTKLGKAAKNAGLLTDAATQARRAGLDVSGAATARNKLTLQHLLDAAEDPAIAMEKFRLARGKGVMGAAPTTAELAEPIGGLLNVGVPFVDDLQYTVKGMPVAEALDRFAGSVRFGNPVGRTFNNLFSADHQGDTRLMQEFISPSQKMDREAIRAELNPLVTEMEALYQTRAADLAAANPGESDAINQALNVVEGIVPDVAGLHGKNAALFQRTKDLATGAGIPVKELIDQNVDYAAARALQGGGVSPAGGNASGALNMKREDIYKNVPGGRAAFRKGYQFLGEKLGQTPTIPDAMLAAELQKTTGLPSVYIKEEGRKLSEKLSDDLSAGRITPKDHAAGLKQILKDYRGNRLQEMIDHARTLDPEVLRGGLFMGPSSAAQIVVNSTADKVARARAFQRAVNDPAALSQYKNSNWIPVEKAAEQLGLDPKVFAGGTAVPEGLVQDLLPKPFKANEGPLGKVMDALRSATQLNKAWMTGAITNPSFPVRNRVSGATTNAYTGITSPLSALTGLLKGVGNTLSGGTLFKNDAQYLARGEAIPGLLNRPGVKELAARHGRTLVDDLDASNFIREAFASSSGNYGGKHTADTILGDLTGEGKFLGGLVGESGPEAFSKRKVAGEVAEALGQAKSLDGLKELFVGAPGFGARTEPTSALLKSGATLNNYVEAQNRLNPWLDMVSKGIAPEEAMRRVNAAQISYDPRNYTDFENRYMTQIAPFYKFMKGATLGHADELIHRPGGGLSQLLQGTSQIHDNEEILPEYVRENLSLPVSKLPFGLSKLFESNDPESKRFLSGLGLMYEAPLRFITGGQGEVPITTETLGEGLGSLNPMLKGLGELATGRSFFQRDENGGRLMTEMDPVIGRLLSNINEMAGGEKTEDAHVLPGWLEAIAANSPLTRVTSSLRSLTDQRENAIPKALLNYLSGARMTDVSDKAVDSTINSLIDQNMKRLPGARTRTDVYIPTDQRTVLTEDQLEAYKQLSLLEKLMHRRQRQEKKAAQGFEDVFSFR